VVPAIAAYQERYPDVTVDLTLSQNVPDLIEDGYDVALRVPSTSLPRVLPEYHLQTLNVFAVYASRQYLDAKIKTWVEFLREWMTQVLGTDDTEIRGISKH
jgi:DNA-binding transcriptional LysR family regulator